MSLILEIARCPIVEHCLGGAADHPCSKIVRSQGAHSVADFQSPEPWSGHITQAPILFLSSNPSISHVEYDEYPHATWEDAAIVDYFENRFGGSPLSSVADGIYNRLPGGERAARSTRYRVGIRARAAELLEMKPHEVRPGFDYALTEIVRCKSRGEEGEPEALSTCADRYLEPTLEASAATVIVVVGAHAAKAIRWRYQLEPGKVHYGPLHIEQRDRMLTLIPHPTGRAPRKKLAGCLSPEELHSLKRWLLS